MTFQLILASPALKSIVGTFAAGVAGFIIVLLDNVTSWGQAVINGIAVITAALFAFGAVWVKVRWDQRKHSEAKLSSAQHADAATSLERERIIDARSNALFDDMEKFYALRERESQAIIIMLKENNANVRADLEQVIAQQRELIVQQAAQLQNQQTTIIQKS